MVGTSREGGWVAKERVAMAITCLLTQATVLAIGLPVGAAKNGATTGGRENKCRSILQIEADALMNK